MPQPPRTRWTQEQLLVAFWLYCTERFGRLHARNPTIIDMAARIGRTSDALAMKACNFASLDPLMVASGRAGLGNVSRDDRALWAAFAAEPTRVAEAASLAWARHAALEVTAPLFASEPTGGPAPTEATRTVRVRLVQTFFRESLLTSYGASCAVTGLAEPELLVASHILPWATNEQRRADPRNGLLLNALLDKAFDRFLITFDESHRLLVSPRLRAEGKRASAILDHEGAVLRMPERFAPDPAALAWHRAEHFARAA